ncbi:DUF6056 family protein [Streptomyces scopuliridis]|uniref:DUF6056 family protein n=1 Tax=Streptomyces scopuliridis TaxID=452529 RepID=UPI00367586C4
MALWPVALSLLPLGLMGAAAWLGRHARPSADEWCFLPYVRDNGISGLIGKFYLGDNGRAANALLVGLYAKFRVAGHQWFGLISAVLVLGVLWAVTALALARTRVTVGRGVPLLVASMATAVFLFATPNTYKTFYWPASSVSHTLAPVLACAAAVPLLLARSRGGRIAAVATVFLAGIFMGTLSEETSVVAFVVLVCVLLLSRRLLAERRLAYARTWCAAGIAGIGAGAMVLLMSPGARTRRERFGAGTTSMLAPDALLGAAHAFARVLWTLATTWQYAGVVAVGVLLGLLARNGRERTTAVLPARPALLACAGALTFLASGYLCSVVAYPVFGSAVGRASRTWNDYLLLYVVLLVGAGAFLGHFLRHGLRLRAGRTRVVKAAGVAVCAVVCLGLAVSLGRLGENMRVRASDWDRQDQWLRIQAASGAQVLPYKPLSISEMGEPFGRGGQKYWPGGCVADYYHLKRITYSKQLP